MGQDMSNALIYAIHGFLGNSFDWDAVKDKLTNVNFVAEDLFSKNQQLDYFLNRVSSFSSFEGKKIFLGYSMGGRLGLQLLKRNPELFDHYIFLSTNPGLPTTADKERKERIVSDRKWSEKINAEDWEIILQEWNSQPVFKGSNIEPKRDLKDYDLLKLKEGIVKWSLGEQEDFSDIIQLNNYKITWVAGDRDEKYCDIAENLKSKGVLLGYNKISAGHRIWLDNPEAVASVIKDLLC